MKHILKSAMPVALMVLASCGSGNNTNSSADSSSTVTRANTDGENTIGLDTAHIDTSAGKIKK